MSKSLGNYIGINEPAFEYVNGELAGMFKKVMSVPDSLIERYFELLSRIPVDAFNSLKEALKDGSKDPRDAKKELAMELVSRYAGIEEAEQARGKYHAVFEEKNISDLEQTFPVLEVSAGSAENAVWLPQVIKNAGLVKGTMRQETIAPDKQAAAEGRSSYVLVNNRSEGCSPLTVQALLEALAIPTDSPL